MIEVWIAIDKNGATNMIIFDEEGNSHFCNSNGVWCDGIGVWSKECAQSSGFELIGTL